jgi:hypothetical protein
VRECPQHGARGRRENASDVRGSACPPGTKRGVGATWSVVVLYGTEKWLDFNHQGSACRARMFRARCYMSGFPRGRSAALRQLCRAGDGRGRREPLLLTLMVPEWRSGTEHGGNSYLWSLASAARSCEHAHGLPHRGSDLQFSSWFICITDVNSAVPRSGDGVLPLNVCTGSPSPCVLGSGTCLEKQPVSHTSVCQGTSSARLQRPLEGAGLWRCWAAATPPVRAYPMQDTADCSHLSASPGSASA